MPSPSKKLGVIVGVDGNSSQVGMYSMSNDSQFIWYGEILTGPRIGAFLTINQNDIKIIATVSSEKIMDQQNTVKSVEFDNRYHKNSINRIITLKTKGVIEEEKFQVTSQYVPMIGNEVTLTTKEELNLIFGLSPEDDSIYIGKSILERQDVNIPINKFFASHIGIFGNTGSGKSNTLHKLYLELFSSVFKEEVLNQSQFFVIDFNGEYVGNETFGIASNNKEIFEINTRTSDVKQKLPIKKSYLFDANILAILFDARPATQVPFLRGALSLYEDKIQDDSFNFGNFVTGTFKKILTTGNSASQDSLENWIATAKKYHTNSDDYCEIDKIKFNSSKNSYYVCVNNETIYFNPGATSAVKNDLWEKIKLDTIAAELTEKFEKADPIDELEMFLDFQREHKTAWDKINREHILPLFNRIYNSFASLRKVAEISDDAYSKFKSMNIISLVHANQEITRLMPMLLSKMVYDEQKSAVAGNDVTQTKHLIIDEAHNILNSEYRNNGDDWQDYRLSVFEEIIKEGRKFGFYLTLSSQRPADISQTIMSQLHNYLIHRLVNEKDLKMLENTMPTLDKNSYQMIPSLGQGEAIITGNAMQVPIFVKVEKEEVNRPKSDDIILTEIWKNIN